MYSEKLAIAVKHNGRVLREHGDTVHIPFGSEYSLHFKNMNSVRALVRVEIDGTDATGGIQLIVPANGSIDLERFIENGNFNRGHKFKFIERTQKIEDGPRGIKTEDGLIRVEFEFEREPAKIVDRTIYRDHYYDRWYPYWNGPYYGGGYTLTSTSGSLVGSATAAYSANSASAKGVTGDTVKLGSRGVDDAGEISCSAASFSAGESQAFLNQVSPTMDSFAIPQNAAMPLNDVGITVKGSESDQHFTEGAWFPTDGQKHVMIIKLLGQVGEKKVAKAVTVKTKQECPTCGAGNRHNSKFCHECGTGLTVV